MIYSPGIRQDRHSGGLFEIVCLLPVENAGFSYRIRDAAGRERIALEYQLENTV